MAQPYCTGPAHLFVGIGVGGSYVYLGTAERAPRIELRPGWEPVWNDIGGTRVPIDMVYEGEEAYVSADLTRWNEAVYAQLAARPNPVTGVRGTGVGGDLGTLMITEGLAYTLVIQFVYGAGFKAAMSTMPGGYRFPIAWVEGPDSLDPIGTQARKIRLIWHCLRILAPSTNNSIAALLYDHNVAGLPAIN